MNAIHLRAASNSNWIEKIWGKTCELIHTPYYSKSELQINSGGYCSLHYHRQRANKFIVISGAVDIIEMYGPNYKITNLGPDNTYDVPSLVPHMFLVLDSGIMLEEYYPDRGGSVYRDDIVRLVHGGVVADIGEFSKFPFSLLNNV